MNNIVYNDVMERFEYQGRHANTPQLLNPELGMVACHRISFKSICDSIINALNWGVFYLKTQTYMESDIFFDMLSSMCGTISAVYCVQIEVKKIEKLRSEDRATRQQEIPGFITRVINQSDNRIGQYINNIWACQMLFPKSQRIFGDATMKRIHDVLYTYIGEQANKIIDILCECQNNVKKGYASSNSSLMDAYDCDDYRVYNDAYLIEGVEDSIALTNMMNLTFGEIDGSGNFVTGVPLFMYEGCFEGKKFLYTSSKVLPAKASEVKQCLSKIYYRYACTENYKQFNEV